MEEPDYDYERDEPTGWVSNPPEAEDFVELTDTLIIVVGLIVALYLAIDGIKLLFS